jgi:membrane protein DedA with SNARE-associated domain
MFEQLINLFIKIIETGGYAGVTFLMALESMVAPVPSEAVMPFAGFLWFLGKMSFAKIVIFSTLGSIVGSLISYCIGAFGGRPLIKKWGKYFLLNEAHLDYTEQFFTRFGNKTIFFSRFIPIVRHLISIPAGIGKMNLLKFIVYTTLGAGIWNGFLAYLGFQLGNKWEEIRKYSEVLDIVFLAAIIGLIFYFIYKQKRTICHSKQREESLY